MLRLILFFSFLHFYSYQSYEIKATGGGIVPLGSDLELSLMVGKVWDRCRWFVYEQHSDVDYCSFDLDPDNGTAKVRARHPVFVLGFCFSKTFF